MVTATEGWCRSIDNPAAPDVLVLAAGGIADGRGAALTMRCCHRVYGVAIKFGADRLSGNVVVAPSKTEAR